MKFIFLLFALATLSFASDDVIAIYEDSPDFLATNPKTYKLFDAAFYHSVTSSYYLFKDSTFIKTDVDGHLDEGWPKRIDSEWGTDASWGANCVFYDDYEDKFWFFKGRSVVSFSSSNPHAKNQKVEVSTVFAVPSDWGTVQSAFYASTEDAIYLFYGDSYTRVLSSSKNVASSGYPKKISDGISLPESWTTYPTLFFTVGKNDALACLKESCVYVDITCDSCMKASPVTQSDTFSLYSISWGVPIRWAKKQRGYLKINLLESLDQTYDKDGKDVVYFKMYNDENKKLGCKIENMKKGERRALPTEVYFPCKNKVDIMLVDGSGNKLSNQTINCVESEHYTLLSFTGNTKALDMVTSVGTSALESQKESTHASTYEKIFKALQKGVDYTMSKNNATYGLKMFVGIDPNHDTEPFSSDENVCSIALFSLSLKTLCTTLTVILIALFGL